MQKGVFSSDFSLKRNAPRYTHFAISDVKRLFYSVFDAEKTKRNGFSGFVASKTPRLRRTRRGNPSGVPLIAVAGLNPKDGFKLKLPQPNHERCPASVMGRAGHRSCASRSHPKITLDDSGVCGQIEHIILAFRSHAV